ncbi:30S ribosomal protein S17 [Candidatus Saccharibacteria bacterium]|nr:30S ribosomal protein S17 [Candidatus Saccharibacteria bacterium]
MARLLTGRVLSSSPDKTIVISVVKRKTHPIYKKQYAVKAKFMAHDEKNEASVGDLVVIRESRPLSARKRFVLYKIIEKARVAFRETDATADMPQEPKVPSQKPKAASGKLSASSSQLSAKVTEGSVT